METGFCLLNHSQRKGSWIQKPRDGNFASYGHRDTKIGDCCLYSAAYGPKYAWKFKS